MEIREARGDDAATIAVVARASWHRAYDDLLGPDVVDATVDEWYDPTPLHGEIERVRECDAGVFLVAGDGADDAEGEAADVAEDVGSGTGDAVADAEGERRDAVADAQARSRSTLGFASAGPARAPDDPAEAFFSRLYVHPDRWGEGIGSALTAAVCRRLRAAGHETVWLEVFEENAVGRSFYESLGFGRADAVEESFGGTTLTTLHLRAKLSAVASDVNR